MRSCRRQAPCVCCATLTRFEREVVGVRGGHIRWDPCCPSCGENGRPTKDAA